MFNQASVNYFSKYHIIFCIPFFIGNYQCSSENQQLLVKQERFTFKHSQFGCIYNRHLKQL